MTSAVGNGPRRLLVTGIGLRRLDPHTPDDDADALVVEGERIAWIGRRDDAPFTAARVDFDGWLTPAFVDAHVHATATGLAAEGIGLSGCASLEQALRRLRDYAAATTLDPILGGQWDETSWPEQRPPHAQELATAAPGRTVLLERVDGHSCVVDAPTLGRLDLERIGESARRSGDIMRDAEGSPTGWLKEHAAEMARMHVHAALSLQRLQRARRAACALAVSLGIASFHEMGHPGLSGLDDATAWRRGTWPLDVLVWWAELDAEAGPRNGLRVGGDLFLDGSIGSATAAVTGGYRDTSGAGSLFHDDGVVALFFLQATGAGRGAGVHVIGDRAIEQALKAVEHAARIVGRAKVRACRHRFEHVELPSPDHALRMADLGIVASVQPAFDATWGGDGGLYAQRFGAQTALLSNPFRWLHDAGVAMAFGSDSTVTPMNPWSGVLAAERHLGGLSVPRTVAWSSHTTGGRYAAGQDHIGPLRLDHRADLVVWDGDPLNSDDPTRLQCLATFVRGGITHRVAGDFSSGNF